MTWPPRSTGHCGRRAAPESRRRRGSLAGVRIATWNVNSVKQRMPRLMPWLEQRRPDVVCLQETKLADAAFADLLAGPLAELGYEAAHHGQGQWNGVALLSRVGLDDVERGFAGQPDFGGVAEARAVMIHIETDLMGPNPPGSSWWDVPISETSRIESTQKAREWYVDMKKPQRHYLR